ncbi:MAG: CPBP family intramembrane glutamic endopeptidase, partial [Anaerolineaceae bacterium]
MTAVPSTSHADHTLTGWIKNHPLASFIILTFMLAVFWLPGNTIDLGFINGFAILGSLGPALSAVLISGIVNPNPSGIPAGRRWRLFGLLTFIILALFAGVRLWMAAGTVSIGGLAHDPRVYPNMPAVVMDVIAAGGAGFVLSGVFSPRQGVRDLLASLELRRRPVKWYGWLFALAVYPVVLLAGNLISAGLGGQPFALNMSGPWYAVILTTIVLLAYFIIGGGGMEEPGWRGFALPRLLTRFKPLGASLILGLVWSLWHWPMLLMQIAAGGYVVAL